MWAPNKRFYGGQREAKRREKNAGLYTLTHKQKTPHTWKKNNQTHTHTHTHIPGENAASYGFSRVPTCNTHRFRWEEGDDSLHTAARYPVRRQNVLETKCYNFSPCLFLCLKKRCHLLKYVQDLKVAEWPTVAASKSQWSWSRGHLETDVRCSPQPGWLGLKRCLWDTCQFEDCG